MKSKHTGNDCFSKRNTQMRELHFTITEDEDGERLDSALHMLVPKFSRSFLQKLIKGGSISLNGSSPKVSTPVRESDEIILNVPDSTVPDIVPENIPLDILYEDDDVLVVNKPKNMVVHPAAGHYSGTLVNAVMYHCGSSLSGINGVMRPGIVHRIDKDTTGSVIICKNDISHRSIAAQLKEHSIVRRYYAIVYGVLDEKLTGNSDEFIINKRIGRDRNNRRRMAVVNAPDGKEAITHVKVIERFPSTRSGSSHGFSEGFTYIECRLETGRTHQIRVHMASIGHPILGDRVYCGCRKSPFAGIDSQVLHAGVLGFIHPVTGKYIETVAPLPDYFKELLGKLGIKGDN